MGLTDLVGGLADNPYFGAGFGLFGVGMGAAVLRKFSQVLLSAKMLNIVNTEILHF